MTAFVALSACSPQQSAEEPVAETSANAAPLALPEIETETEILPDVRQVIPGRAVHVPPVGEELERLPAPPVAPPAPRAVNLGIVVVEEANRLRTRRGMVMLAGTQAIAPDATCPLADGRIPACEVLARTAVRRFVARRTVSCTLGLREDAGEDHTAPCTLGDTDLALWIIAQGWAFANAEASAQMRAAQTTARQEQRGLWASLEDR